MDADFARQRLHRLHMYVWVPLEVSEREEEALLPGGRMVDCMSTSAFSS